MNLAFTAAAAILFGATALVVLASLWRLRHEPVPGRLGTMLARYGLDWGRLAAVGAIGEVSSALDRCVECRARECQEGICANAAFLERIKAAAQR